MAHFFKFFFLFFFVAVMASFVSADGVDKAVCSQPAETGICRINIQRWHYNSAQKKCEKFVYGGCGGNENNFNTESECKIACKGA